MTEEKEESHWSSYAILAAAGLGMAFMIWRSYVNDAPAATYQAPPSAPAPRAPSAPMAPQIETPQSLAALAESEFSAQHYDAAIIAYRKILALKPNDASVYNDLGLALHYSDKPDEAVAALKKATALDPKLQRAWLSTGFVLKSLGRDEAARTALKKCVALDPASEQGREAASMLKR